MTTIRCVFMKYVAVKLAEHQLPPVGSWCCRSCSGHIQIFRKNTEVQMCQYLVTIAFVPLIYETKMEGTNYN